MANNSRGLCPSCGGTEFECCGAKIAAEHRGASTRALELWAMDVLDAWLRMEEPAETRDWRSNYDPVAKLGYCETTWNDGVDPGAVEYKGEDEKAARIAAARALKQAHPELPDEPKETT